MSFAKIKRFQHFIQEFLSNLKKGTQFRHPVVCSFQSFADSSEYLMLHVTHTIVCVTVSDILSSNKKSPDIDFNLVKI